jgi:hypothetical protein
MNRITGRSAFLALLKDEGITHLFGNPGTTELPIMHALKDHPDLTYVMAMQESMVVAIADGFSRASGRLVACNVHVAPGLGNANRLRPLNELCLSSPSDVMSRYSTSAKNVGSTHVALDFLIGFVSFDFGLPDLTRNGPRPAPPHLDRQFQYRRALLHGYRTG